MCSPAMCSACGRTTWSGCGAHVEQVMAKVPVARRCGCRAAPAADTGASSVRTRRLNPFRR